MSSVTTISTESHVGSWQGLTIKEILEKVDLSNIIMEDEDKQKQLSKATTITIPSSGEINPESAYLGPKLWSRSVPMPLTGDNDDFAVMNIDDFLSENGFEEGALSPRSNADDMDTDSMADMEPVEMPTGTKKVSLKRLADDEGSAMTIKSKNDNSFLYAESKRARMEREKEEKKRRAQEIEFSAQDLALATVPGMEFDPRQRAFAPDELRPQPIIRKRKKTFVDMDHKDDRYWEKREKNNVAARRSREARRLKENQIALRTAYLEKENNMLKSQAEEVRAENMELIAEKQILLEKLKKYEG
jgi:hypothetical protein